MSSFQKVIKYCALAIAALIIVSIISVGIAIVSGLISSGTKEFKKYEFNNEVVNTLEISLRASKLSIKDGDKFAIETNNEYVDYSQENGKLIINERKHNVFKYLNDTSVIVYIPSEIKFEEVDITTGAGSVDVEKINTNNLVLELGAGNFTIDELESYERTIINTGVGSTVIKNSSLNNLKLEVGVGKVELNTVLIGNASINAGIGKLSVNLNNSLDNYTIDAEKGIGSIKINNESINKIGNGINKIKIEGGIGSIDIRTR